MASLDASFLLLLGLTLFIAFSIRHAWDQWQVLVMRWEEHRALTGHRPPGYLDADAADDYVTFEDATDADRVPLIEPVDHDQCQVYPDQSALYCDQSPVSLINAPFDQEGDQSPRVTPDQWLEQHRGSSDDPEADLEPVPPDVAQLATLLDMNPHRLLLELIPLARLSQPRADGTPMVGETILIQGGLGITPGGRSAKYAAAKQALLSLRTQHHTTLLMESPAQKQTPPPWGALRVRTKFRTLTPEQAKLRSELGLDAPS